MDLRDDPEYRSLKDDASQVSSLHEAVDYAGGWAPVRHAAGYVVQRAAPLAMGLLASGGGVPMGIAAGAAVPGAVKSLHDALPLPQNRNSMIRQAGAPARQDFYNDLNRGRYVSAASDFVRANGLTLGQFLKDLVPPIPDSPQ